MVGLTVDYLCVDGACTHALTANPTGIVWASLVFVLVFVVVPCQGFCPSMNYSYLHICASVLYLIIVCHKLSIYSCCPCLGGINNKQNGSRMVGNKQVHSPKWVASQRVAELIFLSFLFFPAPSLLKVPTSAVTVWVRRKSGVHPHLRHQSSPSETDPTPWTRSPHCPSSETSTRTWLERWRWGGNPNISRFQCNTEDC